MITVNFTAFRQHARSYLEAAQQGERVRVLCHGKPVADVVAPARRKKIPSWKNPGPQLRIKGVSLSREVLKERRESRW